MAKSWEISKDGKTYTFKLQQGVKFHNVPPVNGREVTSEDAKYSFMRMMADASVIVEKWRPRFQRATEFPKLTMDTPDKYTLVINLEEPHAPFLDSIAYTSSLILPREFVESFPEKIILEGMIGTGPFMPAEYRHQQLATYKRNPDYWKKDSQGGQLPYLDGVEIVRFADPQAAAAAFRARQIDVFSPNKTSMDVLKKDMPNVKSFQANSANITNFRINLKAKPFDDVRVRRAMHLAVDRQQFRDIIGEGITTISGPVTGPLYPDVANTMDWLLSQPGYRQPKTQDIAEAKKLMKEAGYENGFTAEFLVNTGSEDIGSLLTDQLKPLNIAVKVQVLDYSGQLLPRATAGEFQIQYSAGVVFGSDVDTLLAAGFLTGASRNYSRYSNPAFDDLVKKEQRALTIEERRKYAQEAEKLLLEEVPSIFVHNVVGLMLAQPWVYNASKAIPAGSEHQMFGKVWVEKH
ncbi:MAG: ABC transporter substrate-binding protein [Dehalococcoidia bacterium]|nr:ABC transporter substrate-binding protein [Dehalococcoidia bacterium]